MARIANTYLSTDAVGNREELSDVVSRITPEDTPVYSMIRKEKIKSTHPEWEIDDLAPPGKNAVPEGNEFNFAAVRKPARVGNYTQIFRKDFIVSETQEAISNAGRVEKVKHQKLKKGIEVRKDIEYAICANTASKATDPRETGSLPSWYETNASRGNTGSNGGFKNATGLTAAAGSGNRRDFSKRHLDDVMQQVYNAGGHVTHAVCSPRIKSVFTTFMSDATVNVYRTTADGAKTTITATADVYHGDFGRVMIVPNRVMANAGLLSNVHLLNPETLSWKALRSIRSVQNLARTGDAKKGVIIAEGALCVKNEKGIGVIADVNG